MRYFKSLRSKMVFFVFHTMVLSGVLTSIIFLILHIFKMVPNKMYVPVLMPLVTLIVSIIIGIVCSTFLGERILKPLKELTKATEKVAKGDFSVRVSEMPGDNEFSDFLRSFNRMAEELSGTEMFRNDFINNFSHEFKTPMVSILGYAKQLGKEDVTHEQIKEYVKIITSESERLIKMSSNILLLSRFENQQIVSEKENYSLDEQLRRCILLLEKEWNEKCIQFSLDLDKVIFYGNEEIMSHMWINIISNAVKFSPIGGTISIQCKQENDEITISVIDHGIGMDEITIKHIFEKFYQGDKAHSLKGNGLGLALVKRIAELCGGYIKVKSHPGFGTSFFIYLDNKR